MNLTSLNAPNFQTSMMMRAMVVEETGETRTVVVAVVAVATVEEEVEVEGMVEEVVVVVVDTRVTVQVDMVIEIMVEAGEAEAVADQADTTTKNLEAGETREMTTEMIMDHHGTEEVIATEVVIKREDSEEHLK